MKKLLALALASVMALSLVACGGGAATSTPAGSGSGSAAGSVAPTTGKEIVYWSMWEAAEPQGIAIQEAATAYTAETGVNVKIEFKGRTGQREGLEPALDAGQLIDIYDEDVERVNKTWGRFNMNLEEMAAAAGYEDTATKGLVSTARNLSPNGTLDSIPYQPSFMAFFYHPSIFEEAGVTALPTTWDEFLVVCQQVTDAGYVALTNDNAYMTAGFGTHMSHYTGSSDAVAEIVNTNDWSNPAVLATAKDYEELASKGYFSANIESNTFPTGQNGEFALGQVAMYYDGSWVANEVRGMTGPGYEWGVFGYPSVNGGMNGNEASNFGGQALCINKDSKVAQEAFDFIMYLVRGTYDDKLAQATMGIPAESTNTNWPVEIAAGQDFMNGLETRYAWAGGLEANVDATPVLIGAITKLCGGSITADEFVAQMIAGTT